MRLLLLTIALCGIAFAEDARTWALLVGVSEYQKLPRDLWLQYADADAAAMQRFLSGPNGGGIPSEQILTLTNDRATLSSVRAGLETFLRARASQNDTVYLFIAAHGTVDDSGAHILTSDSDPGDLAHTSLSMAEIHQFVEDQTGRSRRVIFLADVCRAAAIAGQKTTSLGASVAELGEVQGEILGLMAARPKEVSMEGPDFGGGHGAFTWSVLRGLSGEADDDKDGRITAGELIDFVTRDVPKLTANRQHPRDFGNMDNSAVLSTVTKAAPVR
jgi:uncharacterized caspase-like protein